MARIERDKQSVEAIYAAAKADNSIVIEAEDYPHGVKFFIRSEDKSPIPGVG